MKKVLKAIWEWFVYLMTGKGEIGRQAVEDGICDFSGQGRDKYGR